MISVTFLLIILPPSGLTQILKQLRGVLHPSGENSDLGSACWEEEEREKGEEEEEQEEVEKEGEMKLLFPGGSTNQREPGELRRHLG